MAHFIFLLRARKLAKVAEEYKKEKAEGLAGGLLPKEEEEQALDEDESEPRKKTAKDYVKIAWKKFEGTPLHRYLLRYRDKRTKEYYCLKSFLGFFGGVLLTYIFFFFFIIGFRFPLRGATYICVLFGIFLCLGLAFSRRIRCYVLLMIPVFFSKEGRQVLMTYAFFLALTGPGKNLMHNMGILTDSMACGQDMIRRTMIQIIELVKTPLRAVKDTLSKMAKVLKAVIAKIKSFFDHIKRIILGILHVIKKAVSWLGNIVSFCNKKIGTPFQRCMKTFDDAITDCKAKMGIMDFLCYVVHVVKPLCYAVKFLDLICLFTEFVSESIVGVVKRKLREFGLQVKTMFYVSIEYSHTYEFEMEASNSTRLVAQTVIKKMTERVEKVTKFFNSLGWALSFLFVFIFFRVYYYKYKYMSSDRYDNQYINKYIIELDLRRARMDRETVLPLELRERKHYCKPTSLRLLAKEKESVLKAMLMLTLTTIKIVIFIVGDYSFYWVLFTIYQQGHREYAQVEAARFELQVSGKGSIADIYKSIGKSLKVPENTDFDIDPVRCLPDPLPPDTDRYVQIGYLVLICWFLTVTEAYGLRLRNIVMSYYHPDRARERAVWLYNHILRSRGNFLKFARRQLRRKLKGEGADPTETVTFSERVYARFPFLAKLMGKSHEKFCILCGAKGTQDEPLIQCFTPNCPGIYCPTCYATLNNICTLCRNPMDYGDLSDISEERDSSDESLYSRHVTPVEESETSDGRETTFKDLETRPRFRDLEKNQTVDYAQKSDFDGTDLGERGEAGLLPPETYRMMRARVSHLLGIRRRQKAERIKARRKEIIQSLREKVEEERMRLAQANQEQEEEEEEEEESPLPTRKRALMEILRLKIQDHKARGESPSRAKAFVENLRERIQREKLRREEKEEKEKEKEKEEEEKEKEEKEEEERGASEEIHEGSASATPRDKYNAMFSKVHDLTKNLKLKSLRHLRRRGEEKENAEEPLLGEPTQREEVTYRKLKNHVKSRVKRIMKLRKNKDATHRGSGGTVAYHVQYSHVDYTRTGGLYYRDEASPEERETNPYFRYPR